MTVKFEKLDILLYSKKISKKIAADAIGVTERTFTKKMKGTTPFTWEQVCTIQQKFFPSFDKDELFSSKKEA